MPMQFALFLFASGAAIGFLSGLLGIGGGIVMFPLLLYGPPLLGLHPIDVKAITGLTMVQGFFASVSAVFFYHKERLVNKPLVFTLGSSLFLSSLTGAFLSKYVPDKLILFIFASLALVAAIMMLLPRSYMHDELKEDKVIFNRPITGAIGIVIGFLVGLVGQGGAFITIPVLLYILKIPLRVTLGSTLAIGLFSATAGVIGKGLTGQIPYLVALPLLAGAIPAARIGAHVGNKTKTHYLKWILAVIIAASAIKIWTDVF